MRFVIIKNKQINKITLTFVRYSDGTTLRRSPRRKTRTAIIAAHAHALVNKRISVTDARQMTEFVWLARREG